MRMTKIEGRRLFSPVRLVVLVILALLSVAWISLPTITEWRFSRAWVNGDADYLNAVYGFPRPVRFVTQERTESGEGYRSVHDGVMQFATSRRNGLSVVFAGDNGAEVRVPAPQGWSRAYPLSAYLFGWRSLSIPDAYWYALPEHEVEIAGREIRIHWKQNRNRRPM